MTAISYIIYLVILLIIFLFKEQLTDYLNLKLNMDIKIKSVWIIYFLSVIFVIITSLAMLIANNSEVTDGFKNLKPSAQNKPNPMFDINTDW